VTEGSEPGPQQHKPVSGREWLKALVVVLVAAAVVIALLIWFVFTFVVQTCAAPTCG
jgi:hypothetical protein